MAGRGKNTRFFWRSEKKVEEIDLEANLFGGDFDFCSSSYSSYLSGLKTSLVCMLVVH